MPRQFSVSQLFLWLFIIVLGIEIGAGLYETLVVLPLWTASPPESVIAYYQHNMANPQIRVECGRPFLDRQHSAGGVDVDRSSSLRVENAT
jgi:hypothetical protein